MSMAREYKLRDLRALVEPTRVHRDVYTNPDLFDVEMDRIWGHSWIYVGHDSQIPDPGDFITTEIGLDPVIMARDDEHKVRVLFNRCRHKGAKLCAKYTGNNPYFRCPYHGWTYRRDGTLRGLPAREGYGAQGYSGGDQGLIPVPQVDDIRGFVFAKKSPSEPGLRAYLGDAALTLENIADRAPAGRVEIAGGRLRYRHPCNWKMFVENLNDAMHPMIAHSSVGMAARGYMKTQPADAIYPREAEILFPFGSSYEFFDKMGVTALPNGHGYMGGTSSIHTAYSDIPGYWEAMVSSYGERRAQAILSSNRHNTIFYPSFTAKDAVQAIRVVRPRAVDETVVETYHFRLVGAPDEMFERTIAYSRLINSSAGMVGPDDLDCYARMQDSLRSTASEWVDLSRHAEADETIGSTRTATGTSDLASRNQFSAWLQLMTATD
ncbi:MAG: benzoate/toluate 1,2-dioxygenase alpha subunit [Gammaproteobacteria bacterium]|jgi:benzoate/toluate 1,2-dioxygenase alpha subunit